jgi:putative redox protein
MGSIRLQWLSGKTFVGTDSTRHGIVISATGEEDGTGVKPSDLLLLALASCSSVDVVEILRKKRLNLTGMEVRVDGDQDDSPPWTFRTIRMHYVLTGPDLNEQAVEQAIHLSEEKYCSVAATVRGTAHITTSFEIQPAPGRVQA